MQRMTVYGDCNNFEVVEPIDHIPDTGLVVIVEGSAGPSFGHTLAIMLGEGFEILNSPKAGFPPTLIVDLIDCGPHSAE